MTWRSYTFLYFLGLGSLLLVSIWQHTPGYMDAEYYFAVGKRLAEGYGFTEMFLWNYLDDPTGLPHPSHSYWMPLTSILAATGMWLSGSTQFWAAKMPFLLLGGLIAPLTACLSYSITKRKDQALLAGILAAVPGFYLSYLSTTDTFGLYMLLGALWIQVIGLLWSQTEREGLLFFLEAFCLGITAGLMHLARADGLVWLFLGLMALAMRQWFQKSQHRINYGQPVAPEKRLNRFVHSILPFLGLLLGYLLIAGFWLWRNLMLFGRLLPPGGERSLWLTDYNELYSFPATILTPGYWWASGLSTILRERLIALGRNMESAWIVQGEIFLAPLILWGLFHWHKDVRVQMGIVGWGITLVIMSFLFPFAGWRGGYFHSGAAIQPLLWAVAPSGLELFVRWGQRIRNWNMRQAISIFNAGIVGLALLLSILAVQKRVIGDSLYEPIWDKPMTDYIRLEKALLDAGALPADLVLVNNPPGYYLASQRPALVIPNGDEETLRRVARRYGARYLILEYDHPRGLEQLFQNPGPRTGMKYLFDVDGTQIFEFTP